jgi:hypothetical protein
MMTIAADPKHLGAPIGITAVLHTWGSAIFVEYSAGAKKNRWLTSTNARMGLVPGG